MKNYLSVSEVRVGINFGESVQDVGRLAVREHKIYFEYNSAFIKSGIEKANLPILPLIYKALIMTFLKVCRVCLTTVCLTAGEGYCLIVL